MIFRLTDLFNVYVEVHVELESILGSCLKSLPQKKSGVVYKTSVF